MSAYRSYHEHDLLRLAKRVNNAKRSYLFVNPLQGKHVPVDPEAALAMMQALGKAVKEKWAGNPLVIGFSETATAIGAAVAAEIGGPCVYIQTTRESDEAVRRWICFSEEHSHATEQKLCCDGLDQRIARSDYILLVDDEISTGKTILNMAAAIRSACPSAEHKPFVVASAMNRVDPERLADFARQNIFFVFLLHLCEEDYEERVKDLPVREAPLPPGGRLGEDAYAVERLDAPLPLPRRGLPAEGYLEACREVTEEILGKDLAVKAKKLLVLGTEECMFPALLLAQALKRSGAAETVRVHATTRSPIGLCHAQGYPITSGVKLRSFYDRDRVSYLYDLDRYDTVLVLTDARTVLPEAAEDLTRSLKDRQCGRIVFLYGGAHV